MAHPWFTPNMFEVERCRSNYTSIKASVKIRLISDRTHYFYGVEGWTKNTGWKEIV